MLGWFVANGAVGTPNMLQRFMYYYHFSDELGGSHNAVVVEHNHGGSVGNGGEHNHGGNTENNEPHNHGLLVSVGGGAADVVAIEPNQQISYNSNYMDSESFHRHVIPNQAEHGHGLTINNEGVYGLGKNMPLWISAIPIIRMS